MAFSGSANESNITLIIKKKKKDLDSNYEVVNVK